MSSPVFDREAALALADGHMDILIELAQTFLEHHRAIMSPIDEAIGQKDAKAIAGAAHDLKGAVSYFGPSSIAELAKELEQVAMDGDLSRADEMHETLRQQMAQFVASLKQLTSDNA